ncbi:MAG TPA: hypothetical protein VM840_07865 [Actinomycetota bacterium]|nr:hypothetical protein [Actinomycetota bacterium]
MGALQMHPRFPEREQRDRAQRAFEIFASDICSQQGRTWDEISEELRSSGIAPRAVPAVIERGWVAVDPDPVRLTLGEHPAHRGGLLIPRGTLRLVERFVGSLSHPAGGRGTPSRRLHPLAWVRSRGHREGRSA